MSSMWNAASDRDYYGPSEEEERAPAEDPYDDFSREELSLYETEAGAL